MSDVIISGSRRITNYGIVAAAIDDAITKFGVYPSLIIEGGQRTFRFRKPVGGVDYFAEMWALRHKIEHKRVDAEWGKYGNAAGPIRNREMAKIGRYLIAIPDTDSSGTIDMIDAARESGFTPDRIYVHYDPELFPEGPTGCLDDGDELSLALRQLTRSSLNNLLPDSE